MGIARLASIMKLLGKAVTGGSVGVIELHTGLAIVVA